MLVGSSLTETKHQSNLGKSEREFKSYHNEMYRDKSWNRFVWENSPVENCVNYSKLTHSYPIRTSAWYIFQLRHTKKFVQTSLTMIIIIFLDIWNLTLSVRKCCVWEKCALFNCFFLEIFLVGIRVFDAQPRQEKSAREGAKERGDRIKHASGANASEIEFCWFEPRTSWYWSIIGFCIKTQY